MGALQVKNTGQHTDQHFRLYLLIKKVLNLGDWIKRSGKYQAFTVAIRNNGKTLQLGAGCLIGETFLHLSGVIHLIGRSLIVEVLQYIFSMHQKP